MVWVLSNLKWLINPDDLTPIFICPMHVASNKCKFGGYAIAKPKSCTSLWSVLILTGIGRFFASSIKGALQFLRISCINTLLLYSFNFFGLPTSQQSLPLHVHGKPPMLIPMIMDCSRIVNCFERAILLSGLYNCYYGIAIFWTITQGSLNKQQLNLQNCLDSW